MELSNKQASLIKRNTTVEERVLITKKKGYSFSTTQSLLYGQSPLNARNLILIKALVSKATSNLNKDLKSINQLKEDLK